MANYTLVQEGLMLDAMNTWHAHKEDLVEALEQMKDGKKLAFRGYTSVQLLRKCHSLWAEAVATHNLPYHFPTTYRPKEKAPTAAELRAAERAAMFAGRTKMTTKQKAKMQTQIAAAKAVLKTREAAKKKRAATLAEKRAAADALKAQEEAAAAKIKAAEDAKKAGRDGPTKVPAAKPPV